MFCACTLWIPTKRWLLTSKYIIDTLKLATFYDVLNYSTCKQTFLKGARFIIPGRIAIPGLILSSGYGRQCSLLVWLGFLKVSQFPLTSYELKSVSWLHNIAPSCEWTCDCVFACGPAIEWNPDAPWPWLGSND